MKKYISLALALIMLFSAVISVPTVLAYGADVTTIIAGSDFQNREGNTAGVAVMDGIFSSINNDGITSADGFFFLGDYDADTINNYESTQAGLNAVKDKAQDFSPVDTYLIKGNHDNIGVAGLSKSGANDAVSGKYGVFVINENDYMWKNDDARTIKKTAQNLVEYLNAKLVSGYDKPIFVLSHLPLHYTMRTRGECDGQYANYIFDVLNEAGSKGLNIVFMYGHDHSNGWDDYLGGSSVFLNKGDNILIAQESNLLYQSSELNFYYLNAGYVGYYDNHNGADDALTMTSIQFDSDEITFKRYDNQGVHNLKAEGKTNSYKGESGYDPDTTVYTSPLKAQLTDVTDSTPLTNVINSETVVLNTYDESGLTKEKLVGSGIQTIKTFSSSGNDTKVLQFNNFSGSDSITGVKIYNPNDSDFAVFTPENGKTYEISFDYRTYHGNYNDLYINIRGTTGTDLSGDILAKVVVIPKKDENFKDEVWRKASVEVKIDKVFTGLAITFEADGTTSSLPRWTMLDNIRIIEKKSGIIINTYDESDLSKKKLVGSGIEIIKGFDNSENNTKVIQFNNFSGSDSITGVKIYNPNDSNFAAFIPEKGKTYEISFKYRTYYGNYNDLYINVRGTTGTGLNGDILANAVVIPKKDANFKDEIWREAKIKVTINKDYTGLAVTFEADGTTSSIPRWSMLDDITVVETVPDVIENEEIINTYDNIGLTKDKLVGSGMQTIGVFANTGNSTKVLQFNNFSGSDSITGVKIYNPNDSNFAAFIPENGKTYEISFRYNTYHGNYNDMYINIRGTTGTDLKGDILANAVVIPKKDENFKDEIWRETKIKVTIDNDYTGFAITFEADGTETSIPRWSMLDDVTVVETEPDIIQDEGIINVAWHIYEIAALEIPIRHVHPDGECANASEDGLWETAEEQEEQKIDPRWAELRKILDNNNK